MVEGRTEEAPEEGVRGLEVVVVGVGTGEGETGGLAEVNVVPGTVEEVPGGRLTEEEAGQSVVATRRCV